MPLLTRAVPRVVRGGGFELLTADPILAAVVRRCAELEAELAAVRRQQDARRRPRRPAQASPHQAPLTSGPGASPGATTVMPAEPQPSQDSADSAGTGGLSTG